jgi:hypothetical protein
MRRTPFRGTFVPSSPPPRLWAPPHQPQRGCQPAPGGQRKLTGISLRRSVPEGIPGLACRSWLGSRMLWLTDGFGGGSKRRPRRSTTSAPSPDWKRTHGGHGADSAVRCTSSSSSTVTTSTSRRAPRPWTSQASPTPTPVPISRTRPPLGTAAASVASSLPTSTSQESWKPALAARSYAARTSRGSSSLSGIRTMMPSAVPGSRPHGPPDGLLDPAAVAAAGAGVALVHAPRSLQRSSAA